MHNIVAFIPQSPTVVVIHNPSRVFGQLISCDIPRKQPIK